MSLRARLLNGWLRHTEKRLLARIQQPGSLRKHVERSARLFFRAPRAVRFGSTFLGGIQAVTVTPAEVRGSALILYFHGGGYVFGSPRTHRSLIAHLAIRTGLEAVLPRYRLAPEHPFPAAPEDAMEAYRAVMDHPGGVIIGGDSAGGGLALILLAQICALGLRQPLGTFCFSPLTDMTFSGGSFEFNANADPILPAHRAADMADMYLQGAAARDPRASPLFAEFKGAAPVWMTAGDTEILLDDSRRMAAHLVQENIDVTCVIAPALPHVWPLFHGLIPEARQTLGELACWITSLSRL